MARQQKTRQPKQKFAKRCMTCMETVIIKVLDGKLVKHCSCNR